MITEITIEDDYNSLTFDCGDLPADQVVYALGHEPNGPFWEGVATFLDAALVEELELDSEADMFCAYGGVEALERLQKLIEPYLSDAVKIDELIKRAEAEDFEFDD